MTPVLVALVVCLSTLAALVLVLRYLERRDGAATRAVTASVEAELRELLKSAEMRLSKLEMQRMTGR